jgi:riboflavin biosynthesis pyrimidine reductase
MIVDQNNALTDYLTRTQVRIRKIGNRCRWILPAQWYSSSDSTAAIQGARSRRETMNPIERLFERDGLPRFALPEALATIHGGDFGVARPVLYANFVSSADGVVALPGVGESGGVVSGNSEPDKFVMGLLRAVADAVLIGAGTFRAGAGDRWHPETAFPLARDAFAELRGRLGLRPQPLLVVVTASGAIDLAQPALADCLLVTTARGEARLRGKLPSGARVVVLDAQHFGGRSLLDLLRAEGLQSILSEGGPSLVGQLVEEGLLDELFLTTSPRLFGRRREDGRKSLIEGVDLGGRSLELLSVRRHGSHLFLRYAL